MSDLIQFTPSQHSFKNSTCNNIIIITDDDHEATVFYSCIHLDVPPDMTSELQGTVGLYFLNNN